MILVSVIFSIIASVLIVLQTVFVLMKDWRDQVHRYYAFFSMSAFGILFTMFLTYAFPQKLDLVLVNRVTQMSTIMTFSSVFALSFVFPKRESLFPFKLALLICLPALLIGLVVVTTGVTIRTAYFKDGVFVREFTDFYTVYAVITFLYIIAAVVNFIKKYLSLTVKIFRLQMRYVFIGSSLSMLIAAFFSIILPRFFGITELYVIGPSLAAFFTISALFYSVIAYHLMDISTVIHKTSIYAIISMVITFPIVTILYLQENRVWIFGMAGEAIISVIIVVLFILFSVYIQPMIDRAFRRKQYQFGTLVDDFIRDVQTMKEMEPIVQRTVDILYRSLFLKNAFFMMLDEKSRRYEKVYSRSMEGESVIEPLDRNSPLIRWFIRNQELLMIGRVYTDDRTFADVRDDIISFFVDNEVEVIAPVYYERRLYGLLCLGGKESLAGFRPEEIEKLEYLQMKCSDFITTAINYDKAMKQQFLARSVNLSADILSKALPSGLPIMDTIRFGAFIVPKYVHGCDYFDFIQSGDQGVGVLITDIAGMGINSALHSVLLQSSFYSSIPDLPSTSSVIQNINNVLYDFSRGRGGLVTAFYCYIDVRNMRLMYTNAGFPALELFRVEKNNFDTLDTEGIPLGYDAHTTYGMGRTGIIRGDIGVLYSKTLTRSKNQKGDEYGLLRLRNAVMESRAKNANDIASRIKTSYEGFMGLSQPDSDITVIVFKIV